LQPIDDSLLSWVLRLAPEAKYNLTSSGLSEPSLEEMGLDTSYEHFAAEKDEHEKLLRETIAELYRARAENVVITSGASEAIFIVYSVLGPGRQAVVPLPNYGPMFTIPRSLGVPVRHSLRGGSDRRRVLLGLTDPNNPTGRLLNTDATDDLHRFAKSGATLFINETYKDFAFWPAPDSFFGGEDKIVVCNTMTKFYGLARLRVGWILAEKQKALQLFRAKRLISGHNSEYSLWLARQALMRRGRFVKRARRTYSENAKLTTEFIEKTGGLSGTIEVAPFCLVRYRGGPDSVTLARRIFEKTGVLVSPGDFFGAPKAFRLCFTLDRERLQVGLNKLSRFMNARLR